MIGTKINCAHKRIMQATNLLLETEFCTVKTAFVNGTICSKCKDHLDPGRVYQIDNNFPRRSDEELGAIRLCCSGCKVFDVETQTCVKDALNRSMPVDTLAQNPTHHCVEGKW